MRPRLFLPVWTSYRKRQARKKGVWRSKGWNHLLLSRCFQKTACPGMPVSTFWISLTCGKMRITSGLPRWWILSVFAWNSGSRRIRHRKRKSSWQICLNICRWGMCGWNCFMMRKDTWRIIISWIRTRWLRFFTTREGIVGPGNMLVKLIRILWNGCLIWNGWCEAGLYGI